MGAPRVSILIPTRNGERDLARLLPVLAAQRVEGGIEFLATDTSSSDGSVELLRAHAFAVESIAPAQFGHGRTRNALAARARGEFLVFFSQDALPEGADFVEKLVAPFAEERVAGSYARILPHAGDDALTARSVLASPQAASAPALFALPSGSKLEDLPLEEALRMLGFCNVASAVRASALRELPFPELVFGEDFAWAARALGLGWELRFTPECVVRHAHHYGPLTAFERFRVDAAFHRRAHGHRLRPGLAGLVRGFGHECLADFAYVRAHGGWGTLVRSPFLRAGQVLGQLYGSRGWRNPFPGSEATREMV
ncbi:MAG: glycosyltransferase family 2 protein [Planctomycetes bacterium]|nr:glycosyltransferase family 2 protein [Planctomycetota bacterium]